MMAGFKEQFEWQKRFIPEVVNLIAPHLIQVSSHEVDCNEAGDLVIRFPRNGTVAVRLRKPSASRYVGEMTLRSKTRYNNTSEVTKIVDGFADFYFYGHVDDAENIWHWYLLDCQKMRAEFIRRPHILHNAMTRQIFNPDGTGFIAFDVERDLSRCVIHRHVSIAEAA